MTEFIFFLTYSDVTIWNALDVFEEIKDTQLKYIGFKDVGLPKEKLKELRARIRKADKLSVTEVVSTTKEDNLRATKVGMELDVDYLIGGIYVEEMLDVLKGTDIKFFPYIGKIVGHPCLQRGTIEEICKDARRVEELGADGIDLLSYRYDGDPIQLTKAVMDAVNIPIVAAGSISSFERIKKMMGLGVWGFTIGTAVLDKKFVSGGSIRDQIEAVMNKIKG